MPRRADTAVHHLRRLRFARGGDRPLWAGLVAVWAHLGLVGLLYLTPLPSPPQVPRLSVWLIPADALGAGQTSTGGPVPVPVPAGRLPAAADRHSGTDTPSPQAPAPSRGAADPALQSGRALAVAPSPGSASPPQVPLADPADALADRLTPSPGTAALQDHLPSAPGVAEAEPAPDPLDQLREAFGWSGIDREALAPRPAWAAAAQASLAPADTGGPTFQALDPEDDPSLAAYIARIERHLADRWAALDLPTHERATGVQGDVQVRYVIHRSGRVTDVIVARSSGYLDLDRMALRAVPARLPRLPRGLDQEQLLHQVVFRYRNPLVVTGMQ